MLRQLFLCVIQYFLYLHFCNGSEIKKYFSLMNADKNR